MPGGRREGAGRPRKQSDTGLTNGVVLDAGISKGFATRVLSRIKELKLRAAGEVGADGKPGKPGPEIKSAEDYALDLLSSRDAAARDFFKLLLAYQLGKPVQPVISADTRETAPELDFGNLVMPTEGIKPRTVN